MRAIEKQQLDSDIYAKKQEKYQMEIRTNEVRPEFDQADRDHKEAMRVIYDKNMKRIKKNRKEAQNAERERQARAKKEADEIRRRRSACGTVKCSTFWLTQSNRLQKCPLFGFEMSEQAE